jgi:hypothetical protein
MKVVFQNIRSEYEGFSSLIQLHAQIGDASGQKIDIEMNQCDWIDANMCAPLGAILYKASRKLNTVTLSNIPAGVKKVLLKNGFLSHYGQEMITDTYGTTVEYKRFEPKDNRYFSDYIEKRLIGKGIPQMSLELLKKFRESIFEIFSNAVTHAETKQGIFSCGQFFPKKHRFDFSIADMGIGIRKNVHQEARLDLSAEDAIVWAMAGRNTTKKRGIPGGLGLKLLQDFIRMNHGRIQIVSDRGYWELSGGKALIKTFPHPFPGTVVNIEINTGDTSSYCLTSEMRSEDIF